MAKQTNTTAKDWPPLFHRDGKVWTYVGYGAWQLLPADDERVKIHWDLVQVGSTRLSSYSGRLATWMENQLTDSSKKVIEFPTQEDKAA